MRRIKSSAKVADEIEALKLSTGLDYIDAILEYCECNELEVESIVSVVKNTPLLSKLETDARAKNFLRS